MVLTVTLNPCIDHTIFLPGLKLHDRNVIERTETDIGGKGVNLSRVVAQLGGQTVASGFLGGSTGNFVRTSLEAQGVKTDFLTIENETRTNVNLETNDGPPTVMSHRGPVVSGLEFESLLSRLAGLIPNSNWVATGGSLPPGIDSDTYWILGKLIRESGRLWLLDADGDAMVRGMEAGPDFVKPNRTEAGRLLRRPVETVIDAIQAARDIRAILVQNGSLSPVAIVSMGDQGAVMACASGVFFGEPLQVEARSTVGSGDSMLGAILAKRVEGLDWPDCLRWGIAAGAATAMTDGTEIANFEQITSLLPLAVVTGLN